MRMSNNFQQPVLPLLVPDQVRFQGQPVAEVLAYLHVQISPISCNVVGSILLVLGKNTDTNILYPEWPHRQGGCLACCGFTFDSAEVHWFTLCTRRSGGTAQEGGGCDQSIGSTVSDAIVRSWLWLTATRSSPVGCFSALLQVVDNWPHFLW